MIYFVVPLAHDHSKFENNELRYMLRSLEKNYQDNYEVLVIGDKRPEWYVGEFKQIERPTASIDYENFYDTLNKLRYLSRNFDRYQFIYIYDDICLLKSMDITFFDIAYYINTTTTNKKWKNTIEKSLSLVSGKNYESHIPVLFDRLKLKLMFESYPYSTHGIPYAPITLYFNRYKHKSQLLKEELCYNEINSNSIWLNYIDKYFLNLNLDKLFPNKSKYEKDI